MRRRLRIIQARYGAGAEHQDVTRALRALVEDGERLIVGVGNGSLGGDPAPNRPKELHVEYRWGLFGRRLHASRQEGEELRLG